MSAMALLTSGDSGAGARRHNRQIVAVYAEGSRDHRLIYIATYGMLVASWSSNCNASRRVALVTVVTARKLSNEPVKIPSSEECLLVAGQAALTVMAAVGPETTQ
jgi:hypothetical protein